MAIGQIVKILNRAPWPLKVMKDGRQHDIPVGESHITEDLVPFARQQNPVMGTEDPNSLQYESLVSVIVKDPKNQRHPLDLLDAELLKSLSVERIDRSLLPPDRQTNVRVTHMPQFPAPGRRVGLEAPSENMVDPSGALAGNHGG